MHHLTYMWNLKKSNSQEDRTIASLGAYGVKKWRDVGHRIQAFIYKMNKIWRGLIYSMVTVVNNNIFYIWNLLME